MTSQPERRFVRPMRASAAITLAATMIAIALTSIASLAPTSVHAQETKTADVIVQFDDSDTAIRTVKFTEPISGYAALMLSGFEVVTTTTSFGPAVCSIEGVGCPADDCFCQSNVWWGYNFWEISAWQGYTAGASSSVIDQTRAVEGWRWGEGGANFTPPMPTVPANQVQAAHAALTWLRSTQVVTDGGFGSIGASVETGLAIGANKEKADNWRAGDAEPTLADYLAAEGEKFADDNAAASGKLAVALAATDTPWPAGALMPSNYYSPTLGAYSKHMGFHIWGLLGAQALGDEIPQDAITYIKDGIMVDGGWEWMEDFGTDTNSTSIAIQALVAVGEPVTATEVISGLTFLRSAQNADGGFTYSPGSPFGTDSDANSTAYAIQALWAACEDPAGFDWMKVGRTPIDYLRRSQLPDGSIEWMPNTGANLLATQQAVPALLGSAQPMTGEGPICPERQLLKRSYLPQIAAE